MKKINNLVTTNVDLTPLKNKIADLKLSINTSPFSLEQSNQATEEFERLMSKALSDKLSECEKTQFRIVSEQMKLSQDVDTLARFEQTLITPLVLIKTDFIVSNEGVSSPAGFDIDSGVYVQNTIMLGTNRRRPNVPACNLELRLYDIRPQDVRKLSPLNA